MDFENLESYLLLELRNIVTHNFIITFGKITVHVTGYISISSILIIVNILYLSARNFRFYKDLLHLDHFILKFYSYHFFTMQRSFIHFLNVMLLNFTNYIYFHFYYLQNIQFSKIN